MTALPSNVDELLATVSALSGKLAGREGNQIREHLQRLAVVLAHPDPGGSEAELRELDRGALAQLAAAIVRLTGIGGPTAKALRGFNLRTLADGLRTFVEYLRAPTAENQAQVEQLVAHMQGAPALQPVPLDELRIEARVQSLAIQSALRRGLEGVEAQRAVERMKREMTALVARLEARARHEGERARTAAEMERLLDQLIGSGNRLGQAIAAERAAIAQAFRRVDLARMSDGMRAFAAWISTPADDAAAHVAALRARLAETLGPPTAGDPLASEAERRADFEREIAAAVEQIFGGARPA
ncbi:MAG TPA: hypothetical protein VGD80_23745 [Kofleriaceae bacterium]